MCQARRVRCDVDVRCDELGPVEAPAGEPTAERGRAQRKRRRGRGHEQPPATRRGRDDQGDDQAVEPGLLHQDRGAAERSGGREPRRRSPPGAEQRCRDRGSRGNGGRKLTVERIALDSWADADDRVERAGEQADRPRDQQAPDRDQAPVDQEQSLRAVDPECPVQVGAVGPAPGDVRVPALVGAYRAHERHPQEHRDRGDGGAFDRERTARRQQAIHAGEGSPGSPPVTLPADG